MKIQTTDIFAAATELFVSCVVIGAAGLVLGIATPIIVGSYLALELRKDIRKDKKSKETK